MAYERQPADTLHSPARAVAPATRDPALTRALLAQLGHFPVFGLLLAPDASHPVAQLVTQRWDALQQVTGSRFLLLAFQPPQAFSAEFEADWRKRLGDDFNDVWGKWQQTKAAAPSAYDYDRMFDNQVIKRADMPCLALFTSPLAEQAVVLGIPNWSEDELWTYLEGVCDTIDTCAEEADPIKRLNLLQQRLISFPAQARQRLGHIAEKAGSFVLAHPAKVVVVTLNIMVAFATANILPIGAAGITLIKGVADALKD